MRHELRIVPVYLERVGGYCVAGDWYLAGYMREVCEGFAVHVEDVKTWGVRPMEARDV